MKPLILGVGFFALTLPVFCQRQVDRFGMSIDPKPLAAFAKLASSRIRKGAITLDRPFRLKYDLAVTPDGSIDLKKSRVLKREGDRNMANLAKRGIDALGKGGYFEYLRGLSSNVKKVLVTVEQDADSFDVVFKMNLGSTSRAMTSASGMNLLLALSRQQRMADNTKFLVERISVVAEGNDFAIKFNSAANKLHEFIRKEASKPI